MQDDSAVTQLHSSFESEGITLPGSMVPADAALLNHPADLAHGLANLALPSLASASLPGVSAQTINSIASSIQSLTGVVPTLPGATAVERSASRNSNCSPAMSDSGISVDAASNGSGNQQTMVTFSALRRLGQVNANSSGASYSLRDLLDQMFRIT